MRKYNSTATKKAVLDAAERLFAEHGFEKTSLRTITAEAGANLGAVNYHFSSKDALIVAVLKRRMQPLNVERLALLAKFEADAKGGPVPVRKIIEALFRPAIEALTSRSKGGKYFLKLISLTLAEPTSHLMPLIKQEFAVVARRFHEALQRALPDSSEAEIYWKLHFAMGAFVHTVAQANVLRLSSAGMCTLSSINDTLKRLVEFCAGGFEAKNDLTMKQAKS